MRLLWHVFTAHARIFTAIIAVFNSFFSTFPFIIAVIVAKFGRVSKIKPMDQQNISSHFKSILVNKLEADQGFETPLKRATNVIYNENGL